MIKLTLADLFAAFPHFLLPEHKEVAPEGIPEPYRSLLAHDRHMTESMEAYHGCPVEVRVLESVLHGEQYARRIVLMKQGTSQIVQGGIVRLQLHWLQPKVKADILAETIPLGRVLINHDLLRNIEVLAYYQFPAAPALQEWLGTQSNLPCFGRLAWIHLEHQPVVQLFEIIPPYE